MDFLPRRGRTVFYLFCQALEKNNQPHLAIQLRQEDDSTLNQTNGSQGLTSHSEQNDKAPFKKFTHLCMFDLRDSVYVTANLCDNVAQIHIRQYDRGNSKLHPIKKDIVMSLPE